MVPVNYLNQTVMCSSCPLYTKLVFLENTRINFCKKLLKAVIHLTIIQAATESLKCSDKISVTWGSRRAEG